MPPFIRTWNRKVYYSDSYKITNVIPKSTIAPSNTILVNSFAISAGVIFSQQIIAGNSPSTGHEPKPTVLVRTSFASPGGSAAIIFR